MGSAFRGTGVRFGRRSSGDAAGHRSSSLAMLLAVSRGDRLEVADPGTERCDRGDTRRDATPSLPQALPFLALCSTALLTRVSALWKGRSAGCASTGVLQLPPNITPGAAVDALTVVAAAEETAGCFVLPPFSSDALTVLGGRGLKKPGPDKPLGYASTP